MVVDDEQPIADILKFNLEKEGYEVICAFDGIRAVELALSEKPDLMLLDLMLPGKDGMDVCREVRAHLRDANHYAYRQRWRDRQGARTGIGCG